MIDRNYVEKNYKAVKKTLKTRGYDLRPDLVRMHREVKRLDREIQEVNRKINTIGGNEELKANLKKLKAEYTIAVQQCDDAWLKVPNLIHPTVPIGTDADQNKELKRVGQAYANDLDYMTFGNTHGIDTNLGTTLTGPRFTVYKGDVATLHRKLLNAALDFYIETGYEYTYVPNLVNQACMTGTGQYPKFKEELYKTDDFYLIPTGEVPLTNLYRETTLTGTPDIKLVTNTPCFRREAGAAGRDTRGIIRQHQFEKVELVRICHPDLGNACLTNMLETVCTFVDKLGITYRVVELCTGDIGFAGHKAYDVEVWFPGEERWREIATITWCHDFQARRMKTFVRNKQTKQLVHTLNGTGLAVGRVMACMLETHGVEVFKMKI